MPPYLWSRLPKADKQEIWKSAMRAAQIEEAHKKFVMDNRQILFKGCGEYLPDYMTASSSTSPQPSAPPPPADLTATCPHPTIPSNLSQAMYGTQQSAREYIVGIINSLPDDMAQDILLKVQQKIEEEQAINVDEEDDQTTEQPRRKCRQQ